MRPVTAIQVSWDGDVMVVRFTAPDGDEFGGQLEPAGDSERDDRNRHDILFACCHHAWDLGGLPKIEGFTAGWVPALEQRFAAAAT